MRNVFDQYSQPENRLTHALAVSLNEDRLLLRKFLQRFLPKPSMPNFRALVIEQQALPGEPEESRRPDERRGLPDIVIHDQQRWCLVIENKIGARLTSDQLKRHRRTIRNRGFDHIFVVAMTKDSHVASGADRSVRWSEFYEWLGGVQDQCDWPNRLQDYLRVAETRLVQEGKLQEGTLTVFDGFPFQSTPYTYAEAKRLLKLAREELAKDPRLDRLGADRGTPGRVAITGSKDPSVWDFFPLAARPHGAPFTKFPHLTLGVHAHCLEVAVTIPNGVATEVRRSFGELGPEGLGEVHRVIVQNARSHLRDGAAIFAIAEQRHYKSQRSPSTTDALLRFKLETSMRGGRGRVKEQVDWLDVFAKLPTTKRANVNVQFQYRAELPWSMPGMAARESLDRIVEAWTAMKPLLDAILPSTARNKSRLQSRRP